MLLTAERSWGPIDHWTFSFKRRWKEAAQEGDVEYAISNGWTLVKLWWIGMVFVTHMMDGLEGNHNIEEYRCIWIEASRLSGTIYKGVIQLEQQIKSASEVLYNSNMLY